MKKKEPKVESSQVAILKDGKDGPFWRTIKKIVENERDDIKDQVFNWEELGIGEKEKDDLIRWHNFLDYFVSLPEKCIKSLETQPVNDGTEESSDENDPYENPLAEVRNKIVKNGK